MPDVEQWLGRYPTVQSVTPRQKRLLTRLAVAVLVLSSAGLTLYFVGGRGSAGRAALLQGAVMWVLSGVFTGVTLRRSPRTEVRVDGVWARADVFAAREVGWADVRSIELAGRFDLQPHAVLVDGSRLELPGVPVDVAEHLRAAVAVARNDPPPAPPPQPERRRDGDEGWEGPFHRG